MWKLHGLLESIISDKRPQLAVELTKKLNKILEIETKLSISFHLQTDGQNKQMSQELEQYLQFFIDYRQKDWPEWLTTAEFAVNNKTYLTTKISLFIANYSRELRMGADIRRKGKVENVTEYTERIKKIQEEAKVILRKT